jgi:hypothetical protein
MSRMSVPNKPGKFELDGVTIIILPDTIEIETRGQQSRVSGEVRRVNGERRRGKSSQKEESLTDRVLGNAKDFVTGRF